MFGQSQLVLQLIQITGATVTKPQGAEVKTHISSYRRESLKFAMQQAQMGEDRLLLRWE